MSSFSSCCLSEKTILRNCSIFRGVVHTCANKLISPGDCEVCEWLESVSISRELGVGFGLEPVTILVRTVSGKPLKDVTNLPTAYATSLSKKRKGRPPGSYTTRFISSLTTEEIWAGLRGISASLRTGKSGAGAVTKRIPMPRKKRRGSVAPGGSENEAQESDLELISISSETLSEWFDVKCFIKHWLNPNKLIK